MLLRGLASSFENVDASRIGAEILNEIAKITSKIRKKDLPKHSVQGR